MHLSLRAASADLVLYRRKNNSLWYWICWYVSHTTLAAQDVPSCTSGSVPELSPSGGRTPSLHASARSQAQTATAHDDHVRATRGLWDMEHKCGSSGCSLRIDEHSRMLDWALRMASMAWTTSIVSLRDADCVSARTTRPLTNVFAIAILVYLVAGSVAQTWWVTGTLL